MLNESKFNSRMNRQKILMVSGNHLLCRLPFMHSIYNLGGHEDLMRCNDNYKAMPCTEAQHFRSRKSLTALQGNQERLVLGAGRWEIPRSTHYALLHPTHLTHYQFKTHVVSKARKTDDLSSWNRRNMDDASSHTLMDLGRNMCMLLTSPNKMRGSLSRKEGGVVSIHRDTL